MTISGSLLCSVIGMPISFKAPCYNKGLYWQYHRYKGLLRLPQNGCKLINDRRLYFIMLARRQFKLHIFNNNRHHSIPIFLNSLILSLYLLSLNRTNPNSYFLPTLLQLFPHILGNIDIIQIFLIRIYIVIFSCHQFD